MKTSRTLLGIDIGTSGLKAMLFNDSGTPLAGAYRPASYLPLPTGHMEQSPDQWWQSLCSVLAEIFSQPDVLPEAIAGIGICGFHHCPVFLQENGQPAIAAMLLHDERLPQSRQELSRLGVLEQIETLTQSMVSAGHFPPIFHYIATHDPEAIARSRWILLAKDYLRFRLTGEIGTEICDATGTNLIQPGQATWSQPLCQLLSVPMEILPPIGKSTDIAGKVTEAAAEQIGLPSGIPVVFGGGDSHCALLGLGGICKGDTVLLLGTNSTLRTVFEQFITQKQIKMWVQHHVIDDHYTTSASSMAGASVFNWFKQSFCNDKDFQTLEKMAAKIAIGSDGLTFLPYLFGERCPFYDPETSGAFIGIKHWHKLEHFLRSILDGVAVNIGNCFDLIQESAQLHQTQIDHIRLGGGGSQLTLWHQIIADSLNRPIHIMNTQEAGTLGAALLAGIGVGTYANPSEAVAATVKVRHIIEPNAENHTIYLELKHKLNDLYRRIH